MELNFIFRIVKWSSTLTYQTVHLLPSCSWDTCSI